VLDRRSSDARSFYDDLFLTVAREVYVRSVKLASLGVLFLVGCKQSPPVVNINTVPGDTGTTFNAAYQINEGASLDLVVDEDNPSAMITADNLPKNAVIQNGIFSFTPDYSQAGLYSINFTITAGTQVTTRTIGVRVLNVIHISPPPLAVVDEGSPAADVTFSSDDPTGTLVTYTADVSNAQGAVFDPVHAKLSFTPSYRWLDTGQPQLEILVTAEGTEIDTGKTDTSTAKVTYQINEATSFGQELVPLFKLPPNTDGTTQSTAGSPPPSPDPNIVSNEGHDCVYCHDGASQSGPRPAFAGMDFHPDQIYTTLFNAAVADKTQNAAACYDGAPNTPTGWAPSMTGVQRVTPKDLTKSLWFMKISGTDGAGNSPQPCGAQMPEGFNSFWWTVSSQDDWNNCALTSTVTDNPCHDKLLCDTNDTTCKLNARYVRKAAIWIMAGAPNN
jgi:hypothetical protein